MSHTKYIYVMINQISCIETGKNNVLCLYVIGRNDYILLSQYNKEILFDIINNYIIDDEDTDSE